MNKTTKNPESLVWDLADLLRGSWKQHEYQDVILPLLLLKRIDTMLEPSRAEVRRKNNQFAGKTDVGPILKATTGLDFYNVSEFDFDTLLDQPSHIAKNFQNYMDGYSENIQEIIAKFDFTKQLERLEGGNILYEMIKQLNQVDLGPNAVDNHEMGTIFENLLRRFSEQSNDTAGEHYTPRDVVGLLAELIVEPDKELLSRPHIGIRVYDPAAGTAGILSVVKQTILGKVNPKADVYLYGQELNPQTYAIAKADMLIKGENSDNIRGGDKDASKASTLSNDQFFGESFDYIAANPPYGVDWKKDKSAVEKEADRGYAGRFGAGTPRISDGQLLFLQHMVSKMRPAVDGGSRVGIVLNGSPLFTGSAGSGESEIRRWLLEKDLVEAIIALPDQLFYNTGISTYIWILSNRKPAERKRKVQLIDARQQFAKRRKSLGNKRKDISEQNARQILDWYTGLKENKHVKIFDTRDFGYRQVTIERPLQQSYQVTPERIEAIKNHKIFQEVPKSKTDLAQLGDQAWPEFTAKVIESLRAMPSTKYQSIDAIKKVYNEILARPKFALMIPLKYSKVIFDQLGEHDEEATISVDRNGHPEADSNLRDTENVPLRQNVTEYFTRTVTPYLPHAWINTRVTDHKDGEVGKVGYEIPFSRYFYEYNPPRNLKEIEADIQQTEQTLRELLKIEDATFEVDAGNLLTLKRVATMINRGASPDYDEGGEAKFINQACIYPDGINFLAIKSASKVSHTPGSRGYLRKGDLLVNSTGTGTLGRVAIFDQDNDGTYFADSHVTIVRPDTEKINPQYLRYVMLSAKFQDAIYTLCVSGSTNQIELSRERFRELQIAVPPTDRQRKIASMLDEKIHRVNEADAILQTSISQLKEYRSSLISSVVDGKAGL